MSIVALGLNHTTAPLELRERASVDGRGISSALQSLSSFPGVSEAAILSTCNRTDLYCGVGTGEDAPTRWFDEFLGIDRGDLAGHLYVHREDAAVRHVMRVASGLDSMVLGEPQILGQLKQAYGLARREGSLGVVLDKLFQRSFSVAKRVRTDTDIGSSPVSVAYAAVTLAHRIFGDFGVRTALLVGAGETVELCARHLASGRIGRMVIANRTLEHARRIATALGAYAISLDEVPLHLGEADIVISSMGAREPIITFEQTRAAVRRRRACPPHDARVGLLRDQHRGRLDVDAGVDGAEQRDGHAGLVELPRHPAAVYADALEELREVLVGAARQGPVGLTGHDDELTGARHRVNRGIPPAQLVDVGRVSGRNSEHGVRRLGRCGLSGGGQKQYPHRRGASDRNESCASRHCCFSFAGRQTNDTKSRVDRTLRGTAGREVLCRLS